MQTDHVGTGPRSGSEFLATAAIACFAYFVFALLVLHLLRPDYSPVNHFISDYAVGPHGWVMTTAFLALSGGCLALALGLARGGPGSIAGWIGIALLGVAAVGLVVTAIYPTDLPGAPYTRSGDIHELTFRVNVGSLILGSLLLSAGFGASPRWRDFRRTALVLFSLVALGAVLQFATLRKGAPYGLANRLFCVLLLAWLGATSIRLRALARRGTA
jgi:hypothetical membrane protein